MLCRSNGATIRDERKRKNTMATGKLTSPSPDDAQTLKRVKWGVVVGSALEWFDFYLFASMAALVFGRVFFSSASPALATLAAFSTFAVGFIVRPIGGVVFGVLGDKLGRKSVLTITFLLMGGSSVLIGLVPSYNSIGIAAPILLVVLRIFQGMGAGAEGATAAVLAYEHAKTGHQGRQAAWPALGANIGLFASSLAIVGLTSLDRDFLDTWGWRIPFVASILLVGFGFWIRRNLPETPEFEQIATDVQKKQNTLHTVRDLLRSNWRAVAVVLVFTLGYNGASYTFKTFSLSYLTQFRDVAANVGAFGVTLASACAIITIPAAGRLSDRFGSKRILVFGAVGTAVLAFPFFWLLNSGQPIYIWAGFILTTGIVIPATFAACGSYLAGQFPAHVRVSGFSIGREVGGAFAGGLAPLIALSMVTMSATNATWGVSLLFVGCAVGIAIACIFDQTRNAARQSSRLQVTEDADVDIDEQELAPHSAR
ncbi:MFS transporter [Rhodococcus koreensis]|uniref:MFS transporter n=1 Tax=Rhodococcus koreensis TaxID=99653 RepID=UPI003671102D